MDSTSPDQDGTHNDVCSACDRSLTLCICNNSEETSTPEVSKSTSLQPLLDYTPPVNNQSPDRPSFRQSHGESDSSVSIDQELDLPSRTADSVSNPKVPTPPWPGTSSSHSDLPRAYLESTGSTRAGEDTTISLSASTSPYLNVDVANEIPLWDSGDDFENPPLVLGKSSIVPCSISLSYRHLPEAIPEKNATGKKPTPIKHSVEQISTRHSDHDIRDNYPSRKGTRVSRISASRSVFPVIDSSAIRFDGPRDQKRTTSSLSALDSFRNGIASNLIRVSEERYMSRAQQILDNKRVAQDIEVSSDISNDASGTAPQRQMSRSLQQAESRLNPTMIPVLGTEISKQPLSSGEEVGLCNNSPNGEQKSEGTTCSVSLTGDEPSNSDSHATDTEHKHISHLLKHMVLDLRETLLRDVFDGLTSEEATDGTGQTRKRQSSVSPNASQAPDKQPTKRFRKEKRVPGHETDGSNDDEEEGDDGPPKRNGKRSPLGFTPRLKCPFYQRAPEKHCRAACRGEGFADMAKLKDHIKRVHTQPLRCGRCWADMPSDDAFLKHQQMEIPCIKTPELPEERITLQALRRLDFKKSPYARAKDTEEKWKLMYTSLFPDETVIPSPYDQHGFTPRLERVLYEVLEEELTRELMPALEPVLKRIKDRIPVILRSCRERLLQESCSATDTQECVKPINEGTDHGKCSEAGSASREACPGRPNMHAAVSLGELPLSEKAKGKLPKGLYPSSSVASSSGKSHGSRHSSSPESIFDPQVTFANPSNTIYCSNDSFENQPTKESGFADALPFSTATRSFPPANSQVFNEPQTTHIDRHTQNQPYQSDYSFPPVLSKENLNMGPLNTSFPAPSLEMSNFPTTNVAETGGIFDKSVISQPSYHYGLQDEFDYSTILSEPWLS